MTTGYQPMEDQELEDIWYFAYGSNLEIDQKERRTGPIRDAKRSRLDGYRLVFNKLGSDGTGKANIARNPASHVWGVVYLCSQVTLEKMDGWEGVANGDYRRIIVRVQTDQGEELEAMTYVAGESFIRPSLVPARNYLQRIVDGARYHKLPDDYLREIQIAGKKERSS